MLDDEQPKPNHQFLLMWCCDGLEFVMDLTEDRQAEVWATLQGQEYISQVPNLMHLELRARANSQRFYEIYTVTAAPGITAQDLRELFDECPQQAADTIRDKGHCWYSDRRNQTKPKIT